MDVVFHRPLRQQHGVGLEAHCHQGRLLLQIAAQLPSRRLASLALRCRSEGRQQGLQLCVPHAAVVQGPARRQQRRQIPIRRQLALPVVEVEISGLQRRQIVLIGQGLYVDLHVVLGDKLIFLCISYKKVFILPLTSARIFYTIFHSCTVFCS